MIAAQVISGQRSSTQRLSGGLEGEHRWFIGLESSPEPGHVWLTAGVLQPLLYDGTSLEMSSTVRWSQGIQTVSG
jgi:hypothetical protein